MQNLPPPLQAAVGAALIATTLSPLGCERNAARRAPTSNDRDAIERRVVHYFRTLADLPEDVLLRVVGLEPSEAAGLLRAEIEIGNAEDRQRLPIVVSLDGRFLVQGDLVDLAEDPHESVRRRIQTDGLPAQGHPAAPVSIVLFVDFQCPFSARTYATIVDGIVPAYPDEVRIVLKHFPLANVHPWAAEASRAVACAADESADLFWSLADELFRRRESIDAENLREHVLAHVARADGDTGWMARCFDDGLTDERVQRDQAEGRRLGVRSTPTLFINGRKLEGARPFEEIAAAIRAVPIRPESPRHSVREGPHEPP